MVDSFGAANSATEIISKSNLCGWQKASYARKKEIVKLRLWNLKREIEQEKDQA